jgi:UDP-N-acetylglucosamine 2-epimerase (non-hydrolysing)
MFDQLSNTYNQITVIDPLSYLEFIYTIRHSSGVITDSGGITEEASILNIPCITLRDSTERPETITLGTNELISDISQLRAYTEKMVAGNWKQTQPIKFWDGKSAERIIDVLAELAAGKPFSGRTSQNG